MPSSPESPTAPTLAGRVGLGEQLTSPAASSAFVWHDGLHHLPDGLLLGVPGSVGALARSRLLSVRGQAAGGDRAAAAGR